MSAVFDIKEYVVDGQHIREYPQATAHSQEEVLQLAVKQYMPKSNPNPQPGDVTILGAHANGFPKEIYEPLWEELLALSDKQGFRIRSIWIADAAWQGESGVLNEAKLGNDPSWSDPARDLLQMVNHFRAEMPRPIVGIGHSFGATVMIDLALIHPRLLSALVLMDPVTTLIDYRNPFAGFEPTSLSAVRRDLWPSREAATASFAKSPFYQRWDPRCLALWNQYGLRETPTLLYPETAAGDGDGSKPVTLVTTKHQEVMTYLRPTSQALGPQGERFFDPAKVMDFKQVPGVTTPAFYRAESPAMTERLPHLRPPALWLFGGESWICNAVVRKEKMDRCGVGLGGSGGVAAGRVAEVTFKSHGHLVPLEAPADCARHAAAWLGPQLRQVWQQEEAGFQHWKHLRKTEAERQTLDDEWLTLLEKPPRRRQKL